MCGIAGYIGKQDGLKIVLSSLRALEYRGYDSAGTAFFDEKNRRIKLCKAPGKLEILIQKTADQKAAPFLAVIGHTRWATHGSPTAANAHPHHDCLRQIFLVHNGIIENYDELKRKLKQAGHHFYSQTDTETVAHLIEEGQKKKANFEQALKAALAKIVGAYALAIINVKEPDKIYFARFGSPLIIGVGTQEYFLASDPSALAGIAQKVIYLKDGQRGWISPSAHAVFPAKGETRRRRPAGLKIEKLDISPVQAHKGKFPHFMLKEIFEGPEVVAAALRGRLLAGKGFVKLGGLENVTIPLRKTKKMEIIACGTSFHAGLIGEMLLEEIAGLPAKTIEASEYRYRQTSHLPSTACLFISQSGETADTLAALREAKQKKNLTLGLVNVVGSAIARETAAGLYNHAGPEIGVASTKAFLSQLSVLGLLALYLTKDRRKAKALIAELAGLPQKIRTILKQNARIKRLARKYQPYQNFMFIGRKYNYPVALEGALKLKEISYVHAEGKAAGELKHGPIALIEPDFPTIALVNRNSVYKKMLSNLQEIKTRHGKILAVATTGDKKIASVVDDVIFVPKTLEPLEPLLNIIPLQLFAYHFGVLRGHDVDKPRNLAKSVTVE